MIGANPDNDRISESTPLETIEMTDFAPTLHLLANRWAGAGTLLPAFSLLAGGRPLEIEEVAEASKATVEEVAKALDAARCERDGQGRLLDLYGLSLAPTLHRLDIAGKMLFSCCALWAHVIPKLIDTTVTVESIDPLRREVVRLSVSPDGIESVHPPGAAATLVVATRMAIEADVCDAFCCQVRHFVSRDSAEEFEAGRATCHAVELSQLQEASGQLYEAIWSAVDA